MKFLHLADMHLGKMLCGASLTENGDQAFYLDRLIGLIDREKPDAVVIAGDVYDRGVPPKEAVTLLGGFLSALAGSERGIPVLMIAGNHDGGERLNFAKELLAGQNVHISGTAERTLTSVTLNTDGEPVTFWLMPYVFPMKVRDLFSLTAEDVPDYESAVRVLLEHQDIDTSRRNVLIAHQFVTAGQNVPVQSDSESAVGGLGAVDHSVFDAFDYVALGHIHSAQHIGRTSVRYAGAPLCYHFSEIGQKKGALMVTLGAKGTEPEYELFELPVLHNMRRITEKFDDIIERERHSSARGEYISAVITDGDIVFDAAEQLRALLESHGSKLLEISFQPEGGYAGGDCGFTDGLHEKTMPELFGEFFEARCGRAMDAMERELIENAAHSIGSGEDAGAEELADRLVRLAMEQEEEK